MRPTRLRGAGPFLRAACTRMHSPTRPSARPLARWCAVVAPFWLAAAYPKAIDALCATHTTPAPSSSSSRFHHQLRTHTSSPATLPRLPLVRTPGIYRRATPRVSPASSLQPHPSCLSLSQVVSSEDTPCRASSLRSFRNDLAQKWCSLLLLRCCVCNVSRRRRPPN